MPTPRNDDPHSHEACLQHHRNNNNSTHTFALLDSGSSVNTGPHGRYLTNYHLSSGSLTAANGSDIPIIGSGSYSPINELTLEKTLLVPSVDSPIVSVSSLTRDNKKIVIFSDPKSYTIPNTT